MKKKLLSISLLLIIPGIVLFAAGPSLNSDDLSNLIESEKDYLLLDVRTAGEYNSGHIPTAELIPYDVLPQGLESLAKDTEIIVYCRSGRRSGIARRVLINAGFTNVQDFGGISRWKGELE